MLDIPVFRRIWLETWFDQTDWGQYIRNSRSAIVPKNDSCFGGAAVFVDNILNGAKPADLPVERPTKFELATQSQDGESSVSLAYLIYVSLVAADEVIE